MIKFDRISSTDSIFDNQEYITDSIIFNSIETARIDGTYNIYSDHKNVIIITSKKGHKVWIWTSNAIKSDTNKLIDICRFLRDCNIPKAEIYLKQEVASNFSDLYALTTLELNYAVKDEFSLAVFTYNGDRIAIDSSEKIIAVDKNNAEDVKLITEFYRSLSDEFRWTDKFERKLNEYLDMNIFALVKNGKIVANVAVAGQTEKFLRIKSVAVLKTERQKGYGYIMASYGINKIKELGLTPILYTHIGNKSAMALWEKIGFKQNDRLYLIKIEDNK